MKQYALGRIINLGSSSKGNSYFIEIHRSKYEKPFNLLIECGFPFTDLTKRLLNKGISLNTIDAILVTHEHLDHAESVPDLLKRGKKVFAPQSVFDKMGVVVEKRYVMKEFEETALADGIRAFGIPLDHENDSGEKVYNLAYIITIENDFKILFATDTKYIRWDLSGYQFNVIFIEANYEKRVLHFAIENSKKNGDGKMSHFMRVLKSHMSLQNTAKTLSTMDLRKTDSIYLIHLTTNTMINHYNYKEYITNYIKKLGYKKIPNIIVAKRNGDFV